jgi:hypothetical protein
MAWSEEARQASIEARKASAEARSEKTRGAHEAAAFAHRRAARIYESSGSHPRGAAPHTKQEHAERDNRIAQHARAAVHHTKMAALYAAKETGDGRTSRS